MFGVNKNILKRDYNEFHSPAPSALSVPEPSVVAFEEYSYTFFNRPLVSLLES